MVIDPVKARSSIHVPVQALGVSQGGSSSNFSSIPRSVGHCSLSWLNNLRTSLPDSQSLECNVYTFPTSEPSSRMCGPDTSSSTLIQLQECGRRRKTILLVWMKRKLLSLWSWLSRWIPKKIHPNDRVYFKIEDGDRDSNKFRLLVDGKRTENVVRMGLRTAYLEELSFPDRQALSKLPLMLDQIMEKEGVDVLQTKSLPTAYQLWKCGFRTGANWSMKIPASTPLGRQFKEVLCRAMENRHILEDASLNALEQIEENFVATVITDAFMYKGELKQFFQQAIWDLNREFPRGHFIDAANRFMRKAEYKSTSKMASCFYEQILFPASHNLTLGLCADCSIEQLFTIANSTGISFERKFGIYAGQLIVFKKEKFECV